MYSRHYYGLIVLLFAAFALGTSVSVSAGFDCVDWNINKQWNPNIKDRGREIRVYPSGVDDTENLQCAFNTAVERGRRTNVGLVEGDYMTRQIVVENFHGWFSGAGEKTVIENCSIDTCGQLDLRDDSGNAFRFPQDLFTSPAERPWPTLIAFIGGDIQVSNMKVRIVGTAPTTDWLIFCFEEDESKCGFRINELSQAFGVIGDKATHTANATFHHVAIKGAPNGSPFFGHNLINGIFYFGLAGGNPEGTGGRFTVKGSKIEAVGVGTSLAGLDQAKVVLRGNHFKDVVFAADPASIHSSTVVFSHNQVNGERGISWDDPSYAFGPPESKDLKLFMTKNVFDTVAEGVYLNAVMSGNRLCFLVGNEFTGPAQNDIFLGADTTRCLVVGKDLNVLDLGTNNRVIDRGH